MLTADTITAERPVGIPAGSADYVPPYWHGTDEEASAIVELTRAIHEWLDAAVEHDLHVARGEFTSSARGAARARCAEILNARAEGK